MRNEAFCRTALAEPDLLNITWQINSGPRRVYVNSHRLAFISKDDIIPRQYVYVPKSQILHVGKKNTSLEVLWHAGWVEKSGDR